MVCPFKFTNSHNQKPPENIQLCVCHTNCLQTTSMKKMNAEHILTCSNNELQHEWHEYTTMKKLNLSNFTNIYFQSFHHNVEPFFPYHPCTNIKFSPIDTVQKIGHLEWTMSKHKNKQTNVTLKLLTTILYPFNYAKLAR